MHLPLRRRCEFVDVPQPTGGHNITLLTLSTLHYSTKFHLAHHLTQRDLAGRPRSVHSRRDKNCTGTLNRVALGGNTRVQHEMVGYVPAIALELTYTTSTVTARDDRGTSVAHRLLVCSGMTVHRAEIACHEGQRVDGCRDNVSGLRGCKYCVWVKLERTECTVQRGQPGVPIELQSFIPLISNETGVGHLLVRQR